MIEQLQRVLQHQFNSVIESSPAGSEDVVFTPLLPAWLTAPSKDVVEKLDLGYFEANTETPAADGSEAREFASVAKHVCSPSDSVIPNLDRLNPVGAPKPVSPVKLKGDVGSLVSDLTRNVAEVCRAPAIAAQVERAQGLWRALETGFLGRIATELQHAFMTGVFPVNRMTRRRPDFVGSSLSTRGLIRFFLTNGSDARIYLKLNAGEKREYKIALVVDRSASLMGQSLLQVHAVCVTMMALKAMELDINTCIVVFGEVVEVVKPCGVAWDGRYALNLFATLSSFEASASMDADGVATAAAMLMACGGRGPAYMMVFSDGYGSRGLRLTATLADALAKGITVVGVAVGGDGTPNGNGLSHSYGHWVVCNRVSALPAAFQAWGNALHGLDSGPTPAGDQGGFAAAELMSAHGDVTRMDQVWEEKYSGYFKELDKQLNEQRTVFVRPGGKESGGGIVEIDIAFLMDCTGSMGRYIAAGKEYIKKVITCVRDALKEKGRGKEPSFQVGFVAYRDFNDAGQLNVTQLTEHTDTVCAAVDRESASGGGDAPEDVCGAFHMANGLAWRPRSAKFAILICDAPCHNTTAKRFHSYGDSHVHDKDPRGYLDPDDQLVAMREKGIRVMITEMTNGSLETMLGMFEAKYNTPDNKFKLKRLKSDPSKVKEDVEAFVRDISTEIAATISLNFM